MAKSWNERGNFVTLALFFLFACTSVYVGIVQTAFSARMRLTLRLNAERRGNGNSVFAGTDSVAECLYLEIEREVFETGAVYLLARLGQVSQVGGTFIVDRIFGEIVEGHQRRVQRVRAWCSSESESIQSK